MFKKPTVFILGAGASAECNLPTGASLKSKIASSARFRFDFAQQTSGDPTLLQALRQLGPDVNIYTHALHELAARIDTCQSIDDALHYISDRPGIVQLGKHAIAHHILEAERQSAIAIRRDK